MITFPPSPPLCTLGLLLIFCVYENHLWMFSIDAQLTPELQVVEFNKTPQEILMNNRVWKWKLKDSHSPTSFLLFAVWSLDQQDQQH